MIVALDERQRPPGPRGIRRAGRAPGKRRGPPPFRALAVTRTVTLPLRSTAMRFLPQDAAQSVVLGLFLTLAFLLFSVGVLGAGIGLWSREALSVAAQSGVDAAVAQGQSVGAATVSYHQDRCVAVQRQRATYVPGGYTVVLPNGSTERMLWRNSTYYAPQCRDGPTETATLTVAPGATASAAMAAAGCDGTADPAPAIGLDAKVCTGATVTPSWSWSAESPVEAEQVATAYLLENAARSLGPRTAVSVVAFSAPLGGTGRVTMTVRAVEPWNPLSLLTGHPVTITTTATAVPARQ